MVRRHLLGIGISIALATGISLPGAIASMGRPAPRVRALPVPQAPEPITPPAPLALPPIPLEVQTKPVQQPSSFALAGPLLLADMASIPLAGIDGSPPDISAMMPSSTMQEIPPTSVTFASPTPVYTTQLCEPIVRPEPRDRGLTVFTQALYRTGCEGYFFKPTEYSAFDLSGMEYGVGLRRDMSINTIAGLSINRMDYQVKGTGYADARKNDISGWLAEASVSTAVRLPVIWDTPFLLEGLVGYGSLKTKGSGTYRELSWREREHDASLLRLNGTVTANQQYKEIFVETSLGFELTRISSDAYTAHWGHTPVEFSVRKKTSTSVSVPFRLTAWQDFSFGWGTAIVRLLTGAVYDFGNGGTAAYAFNASAGGMASPDIRTRSLQLQYDPRGAEFEAGAGLDLWANRGWYCRANYLARFSGSLNQINENRFSLELGACF